MISGPVSTSLERRMPAGPKRARAYAARRAAAYARHRLGAGDLAAPDPPASSPRPLAVSLCDPFIQCPPLFSAAQCAQVKGLEVPVRCFRAASTEASLIVRVRLQSRSASRGARRLQSSRPAHIVLRRQGRASLPSRLRTEVGSLSRRERRGGTRSRSPIGPRSPSPGSGGAERYADAP
jgi:hypothetical protein